MLHVFLLKTISFPRMLGVLLICGALINPSTAKAKAGGVDAGGNGIFLSSPRSERLVLWDLYLHDQRFNDSQVGDQLTSNPGQVGQWVDYREFRSFAFLKSQLKKWKGRAKNLIGLLNADSRFLDEAKNPYLLLLVATSLYSQSLQEVSVPPDFSTEGLLAYPAASFDSATGLIYVNRGLWNRAGLVSQAGLLLHERMRSLQVRFALSNADLQKIVFLLLTKSPDEVPAASYDDSRFSKSWIALHPVPVELGQLFGLEMTPLFRERILNCVRDGDSPDCLRQVYSDYGAKLTAPIPPSVVTESSYDIELAIAKKILGPIDPGGLKFVSSGSRNAPEAIPPKDAPFAKMYGVYKVLACRESSSSRSWDICGKKIMSLIPSPSRALTTMWRLRSERGEFFSSAFSVGETPTPFDSYEERGDSFASYRAKFGGSISTELTITKKTDETFELKYRSSEVDFELTLVKQ